MKNDENEKRKLLLFLLPYTLAFHQPLAQALFEFSLSPCRADGRPTPNTNRQHHRRRTISANQPVSVEELFVDYYYYCRWAMIVSDELEDFKKENSNKQTKPHFSSFLNYFYFDFIWKTKLYTLYLLSSWSARRTMTRLATNTRRSKVHTKQSMQMSNDHCRRRTSGGRRVEAWPNHDETLFALCRVSKLSTRYQQSFASHSPAERDALT